MIQLFKWFKKAADNGDITGKSWIGYMYRNGYSVTKNMTLSIKYFEEAANLNDSYSQKSWGNLF